MFFLFSDQKSLDFQQAVENQRNKGQQIPGGIDEKKKKRFTK